MLEMIDLKKIFGPLNLVEKRPGVYKVLVTFFHEDGDMYDIFVEECPDNAEKVRISDYGLTIMKLSCCSDIDAEDKLQAVESIVNQNHCHFDHGTISIVVDPQQCEYGIMQLIQSVYEVSAAAYDEK